jgi:hypothetical protein
MDNPLSVSKDRIASFCRERGIRRFKDCDHG